MKEEEIKLERLFSCLYTKITQQLHESVHLFALTACVLRTSGNFNNTIIILLLEYAKLNTCSFERLLAMFISHPKKILKDPFKNMTKQQIISCKSSIKSQSQRMFSIAYGIIGGGLIAIVNL